MYNGLRVITFHRKSRSDYALPKCRRNLASFHPQEAPQVLRPWSSPDAYSQSPPSSKATLIPLSGDDDNAFRSSDGMV